MKCPNCDLITSRKHDYCPRCDADLIPHKKALGIYDPSATPPPRQKKKTSTAQPKAKKGFFAKILKKAGTSKISESAEEKKKANVDALPRTQVVETNPVVEAISQQSATSESDVEKQTEETNQIAEDFAAFARKASNSPEYHEIEEETEDPETEDYETDDFDDDDDGEMLFTPESSDDDEHQMSFTPEDMELGAYDDDVSEQFSGDVSGATQEVHAAEDPELESLFAELNLDAHAEGMPQLQDEQLYEAVSEDAIPEILPPASAEDDAGSGLNEQEALKSLAQSLELALGEAQVATEKLQTNEFNSAEEFSLELPLEMLETAEQSTVVEANDPPEEEDEEKALLSGLMASLEELQAGTEEKSIVEKSNDNDDSTAFSDVDKASSTEDSLNDELSMLLGNEIVEEVATDTPGQDPFEDSLAALQSELDAELSELAAEGTTFLGPNEDMVSTPQQSEVQSSTPVDDPLAALQAELDSEISALAGEGTSFLGSDTEATPLEAGEENTPAQTMEVTLPNDIDPLAELEDELSKELEALADIQEGGFFDSEQTDEIGESETDSLSASDPLSDLEQELSQELDALAEIQEGGFFASVEEEQNPEGEGASEDADPLAALEAELAVEMDGLKSEQEGGFFGSAVESPENSEAELVAQELESDLETGFTSAIVETEDSDISFPDLTAVEEELEAELAAIAETESVTEDPQDEIQAEEESAVSEIQTSGRLDVMETGVFLTSDLEKILADNEPEASATNDVEATAGEEKLDDVSQPQNQPLEAATQTGTFLVEDLARILETPPHEEEEAEEAEPEGDEESTVDASAAEVYEEMAEPEPQPQSETPQRLAATETGVFLASDFQRLIEEPHTEEEAAELSPEAEIKESIEEEDAELNSIIEADELLEEEQLDAEGPEFQSVESEDLTLSAESADAFEEEEAQFLAEDENCEEEDYFEDPASVEVSLQEDGLSEPNQAAVEDVYFDEQSLEANTDAEDFPTDTPDSGMELSSDSDEYEEEEDTLVYHELPSEETPLFEDEPEHELDAGDAENEFPEPEADNTPEPESPPTAAHASVEEAEELPPYGAYEDREDDEVTSTLVRAIDSSIFESEDIEGGDTAELSVVELVAALDDLPQEDEELPEHSAEEDSPIILIGKDEQERAPASFGRRSLGFLLDTIVVLGLGAVAVSALGLEAGLFEQLTRQGSFDVLQSLPLVTEFMLCTLAVWVISSFALVAVVGQTLGGKLAGIKVVQLDDTPVTLLQAAVRACAQVLTLTTLGLGVFSFRRKEGRLLHDYIAETRVVKED